MNEERICEIRDVFITEADTISYVLNDIISRSIRKMGVNEVQSIMVRDHML